MRDIYRWLYGPRGRDAVTHPLPMLPEPLEPFARSITDTIKPMPAATVLNGPPADVAGSQLGGRPWWPKGRPYPRARDGSPLFLLTQVNFSETPRLAPFPQSGLLQLFIAEDDLYGANLDDLLASEGFACVFHDRLDVAVDSRAGPDRLSGTGHLPLEAPLTPRALAFTAGRMAVDPTDYRCELLLPDIFASDELIEAYAEWHVEAGTGAAIRLGGYPTFTQQDPRSFPANADIGDLSLLTVDTTNGIMWGDSGAAQFFMHERDLAKRDFSRVAYNWDCC